MGRVSPPTSSFTARVSGSDPTFARWAVCRRCFADPPKSVNGLQWARSRLSGIWDTTSTLAPHRRFSSAASSITRSRRPSSLATGAARGIVPSRSVVLMLADSASVAALTRSHQQSRPEGYDYSCLLSSCDREQGPEVHVASGCPQNQPPACCDIYPSRIPCKQETPSQRPVRVPVWATSSTGEPVMRRNLATG